LDGDPAVTRANERPIYCSRPIGHFTFAHCMPGQDTGCLGRELVVRLDAEKSERVSRRAVERCQAVVVVVLAPHTVVAPPRPEGRR
jgi:hypothetical protein